MTRRLPPARKEVSTSVLKARCSEIVERVASRGETVVVTKRGRPVAKLVPIEAASRPRSLFGFARGAIAVRGDLLAPVEVDWEAEGE